MKLSIRILGALALVLVMAGSAAAQFVAMNGEVRDRDGKPFPGVTVVIKSDDFGSVNEVKTDNKGRFVMSGLRTGLYTLSFKVNGQQVYQMKHRLSANDDTPLIVDFKELIGKESAEAVAARKKQEEEAAKFDTMKAHFDAGKGAADQARAVRDEMQRAPVDQKPALRDKANQLNQTAITEFQAAEKTAPEKDPNLHKVLANLAQAYEGAAMYAEAAGSYEKAIALRPTEPGYYLGWGTALARVDRVEDAQAACDKVVPIDKAMGASCWRNVGIVLWQKNKMKEAVPVLHKALELDDKSAQGWYLLGSALVNTMDYKQEGGKIIPVLQPGTVEAYQKCLELDPNGSFGAQAKEGLEQLQAMGLGIDTKVKATKKKN